jgi:hypothetical protein
VRFAAHVYDGAGKLVVDLTGGLVGGSVTIDATATVRRRCSISVDRTFIPTAGGGGSYGPARNRYGDMRSRYGDGGERTYGDLAQAPSELSPLGGHELIVWRGVMLDGGRVEWVQLGVFGISSVRASASSTAPLVEITGYDRSRLVSMAKWLEPYQVKGSKQSHEVVAAIVKSRIPAIKHSTVSVGSSRVATAAVLGTSTSNDPWQDCQDIAAAADLETFFDHEGSLVDSFGAVIDWRGGLDFQRWGRWCAHRARVRRERRRDLQPGRRHERLRCWWFQRARYCV